jgi:hydrogenase-4 component E
MTSLSQGMAGLVLVFALAQLCTRQLGSVLVLVLAQGLAVSVALAARGLWIPAVLVLAGGVVAPPLAVRRLRLVRDVAPQAHPPGGIRPPLVAAALLALLAAQFATVGLALGVVLLGLLLVVTRPHAVIRALGALVMQFGVALAADQGAVAPWDSLTLAAALPIVPGLLLARVFLHPPTRAGIA